MPQQKRIYVGMHDGFAPSSARMAEKRGNRDRSRLWRTLRPG